MSRAKERHGVIPTKIIQTCPMDKFETKARNHATRKD